MSLATLDLDRPHFSDQQRALRTAPPPDPAPSPRIRAIPDGPEARGFVLYVGIDEAKASASGTDLGALVAALRKLTTDLAPAAETYAAVALAPRDSGGRDLDVVRLALQDPSALARHRQDQQSPEQKAEGVVVDLSRKRVTIDDSTAPLTYKEFGLLQYLVTRVGRTIARAELIAGLWGADDVDAPNERTIDVHVRRLRSKLDGYEDIIRTVRGVGYRFDPHADVSVRHATTPSPDF
ncbi:DNA-binding winged helix-turn-helix (wHTH) protein [Cryobacterium mesophilum]|uniref:Winged helix family transcriptional regulator n=1 Tax=Terrimesophilobacter mesophilus TaxID=433647 RepID=A0A4R8VD84_9MICO|nr:winged helix-turn-helix domain-containing protein [Terrimesophilobacter mesophilus]MBB5633369.1 DNA-binding winged helix-turn-helix (wHTH) protein [Terrimesophilobacter mesophilus]TFB80100.1 winged helix family transcriptional regulator [Terrimesophilobacter mesophilus]